MGAAGVERRETQTQRQRVDVMRKIINTRAERDRGCTVKMSGDM